MKRYIEVSITCTKKKMTVKIIGFFLLGILVEKMVLFSSEFIESFSKKKKGVDRV